MLGSAVAVVVHQPAPASTSVAALAEPARADVLAEAEAEPPTEVSRDAERPPLPNASETQAKITGLMYATQKTAVHADSDASSPTLATVGFRDSVDVTGDEDGDFTQIMHKGAPRWVATEDLATERPAEPLGTAPCPYGSEAGLRPDTIKVHRAVCAKFPQITRYGGVAGRGEHATGQALDIMVSSDLGTQIASFVMKHRAELGVEYIIWRQRIWRPATSPGWRGMSDRGGATANHMDHVHVTTYGSSATS
jgi:hypothetical protein